MAAGESNQLIVDWIIESGKVDYGGVLANRESLLEGLQE